MKQKFSLFIIMPFLISVNSLFSQINNGGVPYVFKNELTTFSNFRSNTPSNQLPYINNLQQQAIADSIKNQSCTTCKSGYYGKGIDASIDIKTQGQLYTLGDNTKVWLLSIESSTAYGFQFYFDKYKLPDGAKLFIFNDDKSMLLGAFTSDNNPADQTKPIKFGTQHIMGKRIFIEYSEPVGVDFQGELSITKVVHIFSDKFLKSGPLGTSKSCNINVSCPEGTGWENEIKSVALILSYDDNHDLEGWCSGSLLNNTSQDGKPLFLSAKHCITYDPADGWPLQKYKPDTWTFLFNHQTTTCSLDGSSVSNSLEQSVYGASILAADGGTSNNSGSPTSDYLLLQLTGASKEDITSFGGCYAGWSLDLTSSPSAVGIHHPSGDVKKISKETDLVLSTPYVSNTVSASANHWRVIWNFGITESGSSGSPLFDYNHRVIGQLHGGYADCDDYVADGIHYGPTEPDWYGKFNVSWQNGSLYTWLAPDNHEVTFLDTYCPTKTPPPESGSGGSSSCIGYTIGKTSIMLNGSNAVKACVSGDISIAPYDPYNDGCKKWWGEVSVEKNKCGDVEAGMCDRLGFGIFGCKCAYVDYHITIAKVNSSQQEVIVGDKWFKKQVTYYKHVEYDRGEIGSSIVLNSSRLQEMGISSLDVNGTYLLKVGGYDRSGNYRESSQYFQYLGVSSSNISLTGNITLSRSTGGIITIANGSITNNIQLSAGTSIDINPNTSINSGYFYATQNDCNIVSRADNSTEGEASLLSEEVNSPNEQLKPNYRITSNDDEINIYPNPTSGSLTIDMPNVDDNTKITIINYLGQQVYSSSITDTKTVIDLSLYTTGVYVVKIMNNELSKVVKVVKN